MTFAVDVGKIKIQWRNDYDAATSYEADDAVYFGGSSWICTVPPNLDGSAGVSLGVEPAIGSANWALMANGSYPDQIGHDGDVLMTDGNAAYWGNASGRLLGAQTFCTNSNQGTWNSRETSGSSWTWTKPLGCRHVLVYCTGGGGGGRCNSNSYRGAGGGGGGTAIGWYDVSAVSTVAVTVGAGGASAYNGGRGGTGGTSSFGTFCSGFGGEGGYTDSPYQGGHGGSSSGGFQNLIGGDGTMSHGADREGGGGASFWHQSGSDHHYVSAHDNQVRMIGYFGSGGSGAGYYAQNNTAYYYGGSGVVVVYAYS